MRSIAQSIDRTVIDPCIRIECKSFLQWHLAMKTSIFLLLFLSYYFYVEWKWPLWFYVHRDRSIDWSINRSVVIKAPYALTTKSDLELFSSVTSSDEDIAIFRGYYCKYQFAERPVRQGIICETSGKRASQTSKQKQNRAKHFGWHWLFKLVRYLTWPLSWIFFSRNVY